MQNGLRSLSRLLTLYFTMEDDVGKGQREEGRRGSQIGGGAFVPLCAAHVLDVCAVHLYMFAQSFQRD